MKPKLDVQLVSFETVTEIEGLWSSTDFAALLETMDYGDTAGMDATELREMCVLSLQDRPLVEAAEILIAHCLGGRLTKGQVQSLAHDLAELGEKLWEHCSDMSLHAELFRVGSLAGMAFPNAIPTPDAVMLTLNVQPGNAAAREALADGLREPMVVRLLADGMPDSAILRRLFEDQIAGDAFPEAESILWSFRATPLSDGVSLDVVSSGYWLDPIADAHEYTSSAYPDAENEDAG